MFSSLFEFQFVIFVKLRFFYAVDRYQKYVEESSLFFLHSAASTFFVGLNIFVIVSVQNIHHVRMTFQKN